MLWRPVIIITEDQKSFIRVRWMLQSIQDHAVDYARQNFVGSDSGVEAIHYFIDEPWSIAR